MKKAKTIRDAFADGKAFIPFITAGDPDLASTKKFILAMEKAGADLIEIGIPFSDPIAEGIVIQEADIRALASGTTTDKIFDMVRELREETDMPLVFMGYLNPVFYYGYERFFTKCEEVGISGVIIPDLPFEEKDECADIAAAHGVDVISMIAPTSESRIGAIASQARGFLYVVSSMGVTGVRSEIKPTWRLSWRPSAELLICRSGSASGSTRRNRPPEWRRWPMPSLLAAPLCA